MKKKFENLQYYYDIFHPMINDSLIGNRQMKEETSNIDNEMS